MSSFGKLSPDMIRDAATALMERLSNGAAVSGGAMSAERMLSRFLPADRVSEIMTEIRGPAGRTTWEKLSNVNEQVLANYLRAEYPQTVAVRSEEHTSELQSLMRISYAVFCLKTKKK